jgi:ATP-binding cassette subfamily B protein
MFLGLNTEAYDRNYNDSVLIRRLLEYYAKYTRRIVFTILTIVSITIIGFLDPIVVSRGLDQLRNSVQAQKAQSELASILTFLVIALLGFAFLNWLLGLIRRRLTARLIADVIANLRQDAFSATIRHDLSFFDKYQSGKIISRISNDTQELSQVSTLIADLVTQFLVLLALVVYLVNVSWQMTLILAVMAPIVFALGIVFRRAARAVTRRGFRVVGEVNANIQEMVSGMRIAKNFRQEPAMYATFQKVNQQAYQVNLRRGLVMSNIFPTLNAFEGIGTAVMAYVGGVFVGQDVITVGVWYLFIISLNKFWFPLTNLASFWSQIQSGLSASERIFALIDAEPTVKQTVPARSASASSDEAVERVMGEIEFKNVNFRYTDQQQVLEDFSLKIKPGESVAFVGHTGAGKSSLVKLITRFYEFQSGQILIDGRDIRTLNLAHYRRQLGLVSQVPFLFSGTVAENIRYANPSLNLDEVAHVASRIGMGEWVHTLPNGLQTEVGERGVRLSLGQRQLVALSRVLAQHPPIFMLDEATASVDPFTEKQIQTALNLILKSSTSILIAHRLSTVKAVDRIIVLDHGHIIEEGNHDSLMAHGGHYATLYETYFKHQSADYRVVL